MAFYLVEGDPEDGALDTLRQKLADQAFVDLRPFGPALSHSLRNARWRPDGTVVWEEEDYCSPPLAQERDAVLDDYLLVSRGRTRGRRRRLGTHPGPSAPVPEPGR